MKNTKRQSIGVVPFKHLIKWLWPKATKRFDPCAEVHDLQYKKVDWAKGKVATAAIDQAFLQCCLVYAQGDKKLEHDAALFYKAARKWGIMRAYLWKIGVRY